MKDPSLCCLEIYIERAFIFNIDTLDIMIKIG